MLSVPLVVSSISEQYLKTKHLISTGVVPVETAATGTGVNAIVLIALSGETAVRNETEHLTETVLLLPSAASVGRMRSALAVERHVAPWTPYAAWPA